MFCIFRKFEPEITIETPPITYFCLAKGGMLHLTTPIKYFVFSMIHIIIMAFFIYYYVFDGRNCLILRLLLSISMFRN